MGKVLIIKGADFSVNAIDIKPIVSVVNEEFWNKNENGGKIDIASENANAANFCRTNLISVIPEKTLKASITGYSAINARAVYFNANLEIIKSDIVDITNTIIPTGASLVGINICTNSAAGDANYTIIPYSSAVNIKIQIE